MSQRLLQRLRSPDAQQRCEACRAAESDPSAVLLLPALAEALADPVRAVAQAASEALVALGRTHDATGPLTAALHGDAPGGRLWAALTLARLEPPQVRLLPALVDGMGLADTKLRWAAARRLVETGRLHGEVLPLLLGLAREAENPRARRMAYFCLRELAPDDGRVAEALLTGSADPELRARRAATAGLAALLDPPAEVFERLVEMLRREPDPACRRIATVALGCLGERRPQAVDEAVRAALLDATRDGSDPDLRRGASRALERIGAAGARG